MGTRFLFSLAGLAAAFMIAADAKAQNTSSVFGPVVDEGESGLEYRAS